MSYHEALEDGVPIKKRTVYRMNAYYPPCQHCGRPVYTWSYQRGIKYTCPICKAKKRALEKSVHTSSQ